MSDLRPSGSQRSTYYQSTTVALSQSPPSLKDDAEGSLKMAFKNHLNSGFTGDDAQPMNLSDLNIECGSDDNKGYSTSKQRK